ncbi:MAG: hypothetical protein CL581_09335 [Alteromonadaceae bacterium]|nr:hypothetical protein [Alteromonadaceae bacterium]
MPQRKWTQYTAVKKYPMLKEYLERFNTTSFYNEVPGLISFFYLQGQALVDHVRIPVWASALDPRIHVFWIQATRSGKTIAWEFTGEVAKLAGLNIDMFTSGTDSALIGSIDSVSDGEGGYETVEKEGLLGGKKCLNFDEGSILLQPNPKQFFSEVILYLQQAMNTVGSHSNTLTKHMKNGKVETESRVSLWITSFPPAGVKEYVLTKGLFQRVLLLYRPWSDDMRQTVSEQRMEGVFKNKLENVMSLEDIAKHFVNIREKTELRVLHLANLSRQDWDGFNPAQKEIVAREVMYDMFQIDASVHPQLMSSVDEYYTLVRGMDKHLSDVVCSFIPNVLNYTVLFAVHLALMRVERDGIPFDGEWKVTGDDVEMATEILYDIYEQLVLWLESEVEVGAKTTEKIARKGKWANAIKSCKTVFIEGKGDGWVLKSDMFDRYASQNGYSRPTVYRKFSEEQKLFRNARVGSAKYVQFKEESQ